MATQKVTQSLNNVSSSIGTRFNQLLLGLRARQMPKPLKRVHKSLMRSSRRSSRYDRNMNDIGGASRTVAVVEYIGSTLVEGESFEPGANYYNTGVTATALQRIVKMSRSGSIVKCYVKISDDKMVLNRADSNDELLDVHLSRLMFLSADSRYKKITLFIIKNTETDRIECHALLSDSVNLANRLFNELVQCYNDFKSTRQISSQSKKEEQEVEVLIKEKEKNGITTTVLNDRNDGGYFEDFNTSRQHEHPRDSNYDLQLPPPAALIHTDLNTSAKHSQSVDDLLFPVIRDTPTSSTFAQRNNSGQQHDNDLDLEFSSFARSRSQADLTDLKPSIHSDWMI